MANQNWMWTLPPTTSPFILSNEVQEWKQSPTLMLWLESQPYKNCPQTCTIPSTSLKASRSWASSPLFPHTLPLEPHICPCVLVSIDVEYRQDGPVQDVYQPHGTRWQNKVSVAWVSTHTPQEPVRRNYIFMPQIFGPVSPHIEYSTVLETHIQYVYMYS